MDGRFDVCVIGAGPVGIAAALECGERGLSVALLESGRLGPFDAEAQHLAEHEIVDSARHAPSELTLRRGLGGTSAIWCGRCVPYDPIDFEPRDWVSEIGWPISLSDVKSHYQAASGYLGCGEPIFRASPTIRGRINNASLERWPAEKNVVQVNRERLATLANVTVHPGVTALDLPINDNGEAALGIYCASTADGTDRFLVEADYIILAMGGIENTRLLLSVQRTWPQKFGGMGGPLGRYYQGHIYGRIADIVFANGQARDFDFNLDADGTYVRRRLTISPDEQRRGRLLNIAFLPDSPLFHDYARRDGALSALFLAMAFPPIGRWALPEAIRLQQIGPAPRRYWPHLWNILRSPRRTVRDLYRIIDQRYHPQATKPGLFNSDNGTFPLYYHAEHAPKRDSRVMLSQSRDQLGLLRARVDLRFSQGDSGSVVASHLTLDSILRVYRIGHLEYHQNKGYRDDQVLAQASDGFHQIGTTRMSSSPRDGVVDEKCRIHDLRNVYVAGSSVFPTSGQANPTFMAVALAVRLAKTIQSRVQAVQLFEVGPPCE